MLGISRVRSMTLAVIRAVRRERAAEYPPLFTSWVVSRIARGSNSVKGEPGSVDQWQVSAKYVRTSMNQS